MGTPTMGGTVIIAGIVAGYCRDAHRVHDRDRGGLSVLLATVLLGVLGFIDDFIKVRRRRSLGLSKTAKMVGQAWWPDLRSWSRHGRGTSHRADLHPHTGSSSGSCSTCGCS
jgi:UDP-N-acetylmuramyl pentapeptide phosphotransferase/UDP-N-acetylglucosamine-1-phosphate transferase